MKKLLLIIALLSIALPCAAADWTLKWDAATGASGYEVGYKPVAATVYSLLDVGNVTSWALPITLSKGSRYSFKVRAYIGSVPTRSFSGDSDEIRFTIPMDPKIIEMPEIPRQLIINFGS